ncbi:MAG: hypothetical protein AAF447_12950 [Myxococcota bacterium]
MRSWLPFALAGLVALALGSFGQASRGSAQRGDGESARVTPHDAGAQRAEAGDDGDPAERVVLGRPRFACPVPPELEQTTTLVVEVVVAAEGRLMRYDVRTPAPPAVLDAVRHCLGVHWNEWEPSRRAGEPVTHAWVAPFVFRATPESARAAVAATLRGAHACVQECDDPPQQYVLRVGVHVGEEGRPTRVRAEGGPPPVNACAARCYRRLAFPVRDRDLAVPVIVHARQPPSAAAPSSAAPSSAAPSSAAPSSAAQVALPPVPAPPAARFVRGRGRFSCPFTERTEFDRLRGEARIRVTVSAEGRLVDFRVRGGTSSLRAFVRQCLEANRDRWQPARDAVSGVPVQASWETTYRIDSEVWDL